jgi:NitT/TauT family transport system permease protein
MDKRTIKRRLIDIAIPVAFFIGACSIWEAVVRLADVPIYILPPPSVIFAEIANLNLSLLKDTGVTMLESVAGFIAANCLAFALAVVFAHSRILEKGLYPYAIALKTTPIVAIAPLLVLWFGTDIRSKIVAAALICFFPVLVNVTRGLRAVDEEALDLFESLAASKWQVFRMLRLPNSLPYLFSALKISTSLSVVGAIVGEFVGSNKGLGYLILVSSYHLETPAMFAAIIAAALGGVAFFGVVSLIERKVLIWQEPSEV